MSKAPHTADEDTPRRKRRGASVMAWVLMAMIVGGLGGFGVQNFGGGASSVGAVGDTKITAEDYARGLRQQINAMSRQFGMQVTMDQAQAMGIDRQVLEGLVTRTALDNEAAVIGLSVGDAVVAGELAKVAAFQGVAGGFDREAYRSTLKQNNMTELAFESGIRSDTARQLLQTAVAGGTPAPATLTDTLYAWAAETRGFSLLRLTEADLPAPIAEPTADELKAYYDANIAAYTRPEAKRIQYAALLPETLAPTLEVPEADVKAAYDARIADYVIPEKRLVERLVYPTDAEAAAAKARLDAGESFETLVADRKLALEDIDMGDVSKAELGAAGDAVFALTEPGIVGPLPSDLGPALFRMNAILAAQETPFDAVKAELLLGLQTEAARKVISDKVEAIDDALAGGVSLEDLAKEQGMVLATTDYAAGADDNDPITNYAAFRDAAGAIAEGDFPEAIVLDDGGLMSMQLVETVPPTPVPLDKITDKVTAAWKAAALAKALAEKAATVKAAVEGGAALGSQGIVSRAAQMDRQGTLPDAPPAVLEAVFQMKPGELRLIEATGYTALVQLDSITPAATEGEDATAMREALATQARQAIAEDVFTLYSGALTNRSGFTLDQGVINAVNTQMGQ